MSSYAISKTLIIRTHAHNDLLASFELPVNDRHHAEEISFDVIVSSSRQDFLARTAIAQSEPRCVDFKTSASLTDISGHTRNGHWRGLALVMLCLLASVLSLTSQLDFISITKYEAIGKRTQEEEGT